MPDRPGRQVCPLCATDDDVTMDNVDVDVWEFVCSGPSHAEPFQWKPRTSAPASTPPRRAQPERRQESRAAELGVFGDLLACVHAGEWVEYGVVEYRYALRTPDAYSELVDEFGHRSIAPSEFTVSAFLARALGQLAEEDKLQLRKEPGTGYWSYLRRVSYWAVPGAPPADVLTWEAFATAEGLDPTGWPATVA
jgi:hypothetical protein